jgi:hypothetical protein
MSHISDMNILRLQCKESPMLLDAGEVEEPVGGQRKALLEIGNEALMSTPDALPTEIALIALLLFKFQVYSTSLHHYYHMASINALRLPLKKFFCP